MTPDPFPNELVEAAAVVCYSLAPEHDTSTYPHGYVPYDEARPSSRENARADALEVLTALYPLIEQRARLDERERLSSRVHENGWCPTCARDTDEAAMQRVIDRLAREAARASMTDPFPNDPNERTTVFHQQAGFYAERLTDGSCPQEYAPLGAAGDPVPAAALSPEQTTATEPEGSGDAAR